MQDISIKSVVTMTRIVASAECDQARSERLVSTVSVRRSSAKGTHVSALVVRSVTRRGCRCTPVHARFDVNLPARLCQQLPPNFPASATGQGRLNHTPSSCSMDIERAVRTSDRTENIFQAANLTE